MAAVNPPQALSARAESGSRSPISSATRVRRIRLRAAVRHVALLITALIILIIAATAVPADWWNAVDLLTTLLLVPWILLFPSDHPNQD